MLQLRHDRAVKIITALSLALAALLLFSVQPLVGRLLLPLVGGAAAGWAVVLCFFQVALLAGYALAHGLRTLPPRGQLGAALLLLALGGLCLPITLTGHLPAVPDPASVFLALLYGVGLPALALGMLSPLVQRVHHLSAPTHGGRTYRLYVASNIGSLLGLLLYPLALEPFLTLGQQGQLWRIGYALLFLLLVVQLGFIRPDLHPGQPSHPALSPREKGVWLFFSAIPAALSVALATQLSARFGSIPLIWILPLLMYLLSFILAFSGRLPALRVPCALLAPVLLLSAHILDEVTLLSDFAIAGLRLLAFLMAALYAHLQLVAAQPAPAALTHYYLWLALGGALGGLAATFAAPLLFRQPVEFELLFGVLLLVGAPPAAMRALRILGSALLLFALVQLLGVFVPEQGRYYRNFYGVSQVVDRRDHQGEMHRLLISNGGIHGLQRYAPAPVLTPEMNFGVLRPLFAQPHIQRVGVVGAGVGMVACYTAPGRAFTFYEIDPKHRMIAETEFTYINACGTPRWRMGDGRLLLAQDRDVVYDLLMIDAFQGAQLPLHLISLEALRLYQTRLTTQGLLLYNLNSHYYNFKPQMAAQAQVIGWQAWLAPDTWVLLAPPQVDVSVLRWAGWVPLPAAPGARVWTDDHANLLGALR